MLILNVSIFGNRLMDGKLYDCIMFEILKDNYYPYAFKDLFDYTGYIYSVDESLFYNNGTGYFSDKHIEIKDKKYIPNVLKELNKVDRNIIRLVPFRDLDTYLKEIGCNFEDYISRREKRIDKICIVTYEMTMKELNNFVDRFNAVGRTSFSSY